MAEKRKLSSSEIPEKKVKNDISKQKGDWISGTGLYHILLQDHLQEWLKIHSPSLLSSKSLFLETLLQAGKEFEKGIFSLLKGMLEESSFSYREFPGYYDRSQLSNVIQAMKEKVDVIFSPSIYSEKEKFYGVPDLLVRTNIINTLIPDAFTVEELQQYQNGYLIIDVKFMTLPLAADGQHLLNSGHIRAYKGQLYIYHTILKAISKKLKQTVVPFACLLGRAAKQTSKGETYYFTSFQKLGRVHFSLRDKEVCQEVQAGAEWLRVCRREGESWLDDLDQHSELYPNMKSHESNPFKEGLAEGLGEITSLWYCGMKERKKAFQKEIYSWHNPNFSSETVGFQGQRARILDAILEVNRPNGPFMLPQRIEKMRKAISCINKKEFYVDFETIPEFLGEERIFMISVGWLNEASEWCCETFPLEEMSDAAELKMATDFVTLIGQDSELYHWADAEYHIWESFLARMGKLTDPLFSLGDRWTDLLYVFKEEPITVKGAFNFSLKSIVKAMKDIIHLDYKAGEVQDGLTAAVKAVQHYSVYKTYFPTPDMEEIIKYNQLDCQALMKILEYLRSQNGL